MELATRAALALLASVVILVATQTFGIGVWPDSVDYFAVSSNLANGRGFSSFEGSGYLVFQPPLYPILLAPHAWVGTDPAVFARYLNAVLIFAIAYMTLATAARLCGWWSMIAAGILLTSVPLFSVGTYALSEALFIALGLAALHFSWRHGEKQRLADLVLCGLFVGAATATRHIGVTLLAAAGLALLLTSGPSLARKIKDGLILGALALIPAVLYAAHTYSVTGTLGGPRPPSTLDYLDTTTMFLGTLSAWLVPPWRVGAEVAMGIAAVAWVGLLAALAGYWQRIRPPLPHVLFLVIYPTALIVLRANSSFGALDDRLLAPIVPVAAIAITAIVAVLPARRLAAATLAVWLVAWPARWTQHQIAQFMAAGGGFSGTEFRDKDVIAFVGRHVRDGTIYTNAPHALYHLHGVDARWIPSTGAGLWRHSHAQSTEPLRDINEPSYVVLVDWLYLPDLRSLDEIGDGLLLTPIFESQDGSVYRISRIAPS